MMSPRMRPRFEMRVPFSTSEAIDRLSRRLDHPDCPCIGTIAGHHFHLNINRREQRIWSPHLTLEVVGDGTGAIINGHFGPRPDIWTLAMALYAVSLFIVVMGLMFAASQWVLGMPLWSLWFVLGAAVMGIVVYILALIGQAFSQDQMAMLLRYVEETQDIPETVRSAD